MLKINPTKQKNVLVFVLPREQGGKSKGKKSAPERVVVTTRYIEAERLRCMCPRLGDAYARSETVGEVRADVVFHRLRKVLIVR